MVRLAACAFGLAIVTVAHAGPPTDEPTELHKQLKAFELKNDFAAAVSVAEKLVALATQRDGRDGREAVRAREELALDLDRNDEYTRSLKEYQELVVLEEK